MNTEPIPYPTDQAHWEALQRIASADRDAGRLPCWDYIADYQRILGEPLPQISDELLGFLDRCKTLAQVPCEHRITKQLFADNDCAMPDGMEDLPVIWACGIRRFVREMLWVDHDTDRLKRFFDWNVVMRQGAFLEILFKQSLGRANWPDQASMILEFHRFLEPCGLTEPGRLKEFI